MTPIHTVLFPTDFSEVAGAAFSLATALARAYGARLVVLHVATPPPFVAPGELERTLERPTGYRRQLEAELRNHPALGPRTPVSYRLEAGDPAVQILRVAREEGADLIVMGSHGRTGLGRLLLGSVAEQVSRKAPCPVLTSKVPPARGRDPRASHAGAGVREPCSPPEE